MIVAKLAKIQKIPIPQLTYDSKAAGRVSVLFWQHTSKSTVIYCRLTCNGKRYDRSTGLKCSKGEFDTQTQRFTNNHAFNTILNDIVARVHSAQADFRLAGRSIKLEELWMLANGISPKKQQSNLLHCIDRFHKQRTEEYELGRTSLATFKKMATWNKLINLFSAESYGKDGEIQNVKPADAHRFLLWLQKRFNHSNNYACMVVEHFKRMLNFAVENEWIVRNPFMNYRRKFDKLQTERLTEAEVDKLRTAAIFAPAVDHIRTAFIFQCYTGLPYAELVRVSESNIIADEKTGAEYLKIDRSKTGTESIIPLTMEARKIINSFADHPVRKEKGLLIPMISNQKYNVHLKQLAGLVGLNKTLTSHVARRTAATLFLTKGAPLESVSAMLGHTNTKTTQRHYSVTRPERVIRDIQAITPLSMAQ
ncbi:site-specific integrase [Dyadobacter jiangsuensis]|uniref:Site-specific recombinase XerD n=1 Tax=Dyadobacter jiangsuensis TaxID=1591085 RepID=A0A2P8FVG9_9BACT|nr:site-specific integrase [Dyadobacter jiangsuensis]PSL25718.1 site-specific recombinase XerD [Dyadobacter jiangsuensis]